MSTSDRPSPQAFRHRRFSDRQGPDADAGRYQREESDIGDLREGEIADFGVDAFPDRVFEGTVGQVRQVPISIQNVTTYDVVVNVPNPEFLLKPGMTANVTIISARRDNVLRIPIQALQFSPIFAKSSAANPFTPREKRVWIADGSVIKPVSIVTGLDDGHYVEGHERRAQAGRSGRNRGVAFRRYSPAASLAASSSPLRLAH